ncbi:MAG TPA: hypothetical protein VEJ38_12030 [Candidatus Acidoferrales bacterium]|nr:hypothetical protein [Candidatus Acidoferrales bacterium]
MIPRLIVGLCAVLVATANGFSVRREIFSALALAEPQTADKPAESAPASATADPAEVRFTGEVVRGEIYEHDVGHNLVFRLTPAVSDEGGGWVIGMLPSVEPPDEPLEFVEVATPPYHGYNDRYLAATAGYSSREAVQITTRHFYFVKSVHDQHVASEVVNAQLYPSSVSDAERSRIDLESASLNLGSGEFRILHSHINSSKGGAPETIASVQFEVRLKFSPGITLQSVLAPKPVHEP